MTEREWEQYRLSVVEGMPDSPYKTTVIEGIKHKLMMLERAESTRLKATERVPKKAKRAGAA